MLLIFFLFHNNRHLNKEEIMLPFPLPKNSFLVAFNVMKAEVRGSRRGRQSEMRGEAFSFPPKLQFLHPWPCLISRRPNETLIDKFLGLAKLFKFTHMNTEMLSDSSIVEEESEVPSNPLEAEWVCLYNT